MNNIEKWDGDSSWDFFIWNKSHNPGMRKCKNVIVYKKKEIK